MLGYDGQFLLLYLHKQCIVPEIVTRGLEILQMKVNGITILDTLNYLPMPLSAMPQAFGLEGCKGHFPHFFNTAENWNYSGPLPDSTLVVLFFSSVILFFLFFLCIIDVCTGSTAHHL